MFDNLREQANSSPFYEEEAQFQAAAGTGAAPPRRFSGGRILGMTAPQRFFISLMFLLVVCVLGALVLFMTGKFGML
jgi:hypothetical protein